MCEDGAAESVKISDDDLKRVRELRKGIAERLFEANAILAKYAGVDPDSITAVMVRRKRKAGFEFDGVPPAWQDDCTQYNSGGACAYLECDPPGVTKQCPPVTLPTPT
jgi:hypothetical protein